MGHRLRDPNRRLQRPHRGCAGPGCRGEHRGLLLGKRGRQHRPVQNGRDPAVPELLEEQHASARSGGGRPSVGQDAYAQGPLTRCQGARGVPEDLPVRFRREGRQGQAAEEEEEEGDDARRRQRRRRRRQRHHRSEGVPHRRRRGHVSECRPIGEVRGLPDASEDPPRTLPLRTLARHPGRAGRGRRKRSEASDALLSRERYRTLEAWSLRWTDRGGSVETPEQAIEKG
mmetsp:Transcript_3217/g.7499  ORF Transcript_3217/g.7499 Transcript_3217/m.7499 type:complete len:229 (-) Transcript_3217:1333-2019(-)